MNDFFVCVRILVWCIFVVQRFGRQQKNNHEKSRKENTRNYTNGQELSVSIYNSTFVIH